MIWQCCHETYLLSQEPKKLLKLRKSRMNYRKQKNSFQAYQKTKKKTRRYEKKLRKKLLKFLLKLIRQLEELSAKKLSIKQEEKLKHIKKVYEQQQAKLYGHQPIKDRIVSLGKPYIRPIVRVKEVKKVEFGAKVNILQVGGIQLHRASRLRCF